MHPPVTDDDTGLRRLGEHLVERGVLTHDALDDALAEQERSAAASATSCSPAGWSTAPT